jgi:voltage-gated potassium channel
MRRIRLALAALVAVIVAGTVGYVLLGFTLLDALYQTVTTVSTVGFREVKPLSTTGKVFTIGLILAGVGTALYAFTTVLEAFVEGHVRQHMEARRMERTISRMRDHVIICGWGRVGQATAAYLTAVGKPVVVIDRDPARLESIDLPSVLGDISDDDVLHRAGLAHAHALVAALEGDADNVFVSLSARALRPDLIIVARARNEESTAKLLRAGADRVVNPQLIGGRRMAAFASQPHVAEFLDVVMHDTSLEFRIEQIEVAAGSAMAGHSIADCGIGETGVVVLALRPTSAGDFVPNPPAESRLDARSIVIAVGTPAQLEQVRERARQLTRAR